MGYYKEAVAAGACDEALSAMINSRTLDRFLERRMAPEWLVWYANRVLRRRFPPHMAKAEDIIRRDPYHWAQYERYFVSETGLLDSRD